MIEVFCVDRGRSWCLSADGFVWLGGRISIGELQGLFWLRDLGHGCLGEKAPAFQLPFLLLLQQLAAHQPHDRSVVGEDADHVGAAFGFLSVVKPLQRRCPSAAGPRAAAMQARPVVAGLHGRLGPG